MAEAVNITKDGNDHDKRFAARVRVRDEIKSTLAGQTLRVVRIERGYGGKVIYLCEMPGYAHPGRFQEKEVEVVHGDA